MKAYIIIFLVITITLVFYLAFFRDNNILTGKIENKDFESPTKDKFNFLWSKGLSEKNDYTLKKTGIVSSKEIILNQMKGDKIWLRPVDLDIFSKNLNILTNDVILVTSDGDQSIPSDIKKNIFNEIINHPKIIKWYAQNYDGSVKNKKLKNYPIGFDLHTTRTIFGIPTNLFTTNVSKKINYMLSIRKNFSSKKDKIFCDVHFTKHSNFNNERQRVEDILYKSKNCYFLPYHIGQNSIWDKYSSYKFIISVFGNGLDCHRTWEALFLGAIVIVKKSSLDPLYKDLPVVIVDDWDECLDKNNLKKWENKYSKLTNYDHLNKFFKYDHWIK